MRVLMLSQDPNIIKPSGEAHLRMLEYTKLFDELHIMVTVNDSDIFLPSGNLFIYALSGVFPLNFLRIITQGYKILCKRRIDVISVQAPDEYGLIGFLLSKLFDVPLQIQVHTDIMSPWYRRASWKEFTRYWLARFLIPRSSSVRVVSQRVRNSIYRTKFGIRTELSTVRVLPIFTDTSKFLSAIRDSRIDDRFHNYSFKMIAVGRFVEKEKNFNMLIEIMRDFVKICADALLVIVGDGPNKKNYELKIKNYGLSRNVILESWRDNLPSFYKSFDLYLMSSNYEGWGRTVIEAMASGLPVIITDVGLAGEVVINGENGVIVPVGDKKKFLEAVSRLYHDSLKRKYLAKAGVETIKLLSPRTKEEYLTLYRKTYEITGSNPKS